MVLVYDNVTVLVRLFLSWEEIYVGNFLHNAEAPTKAFDLRTTRTEDQQIDNCVDMYC